MSSQLALFPAPEVPAGAVVAIYRKRAHRGPMDPLPTARLVAGRGVEGSVDRSRRRQLTLVAAEDWAAALAEAGAPADTSPGRRRANLVVRGLALARTRGRVLRVGGVRLRIGGELTPCERMDEVAPGLQAAMRRDWRGGVFAEVLDDGPVAVGDAATWEPASLAESSRATAGGAETVAGRGP